MAQPNKDRFFKDPVDPSTVDPHAAAFVQQPYRPAAVSAAELAGQLQELNPIDPEDAIAERRDEALWNGKLPGSKDHATFLHNLGLRMLRGMSKDDIKKTTIRDRVTAAKALFEQAQVLLEKPSGNVDYDTRRTVAEALPALQAEIARRQREKQTIEVKANV